ncbi:MAG: hexapeptide transferase [Bacilli bacterium]|nr:hexapeptide transferase [Bacilli bacterium]
MKKIKYLLSLITKMDYKNMLKITKNVSKKAKKPFIVILFDIIYCGIKYQAGYYDYQEFEFYLLNKDERKTYLTRGINNSLVKKYNNKEYWYQLQDKIEFNKKFDKYLKRDWLDLRESSVEEFEKFCKNKEFIVAKELDNCGGKGIDKVIINKKDIKKIYDTLIINKQYLVEEAIIQNKKVSKLYDGSVNTLRLFTFYDGKEVYVLNSIFKIGNNGFVDNFSSGGMYTFLDKKGKIIVPAIDQADNKITVHPTTNEKILGFTIPNYDKACEMVKEASKLIPEVKYIGWDVAILENDVCLVEGNEFPGVFQIKPSFENTKTHTGILNEYKKYMDI